MQNDDLSEDHIDAGSATGSADRGSGVERAPRKVCVLDDDRLVLALATKVIEESGLTVEGFEDARDAKAYLLREKCDIVVLDLVMPDVSGVEILAWLREFSPFSRIINMTGVAPVPTLLACWRDGADGCVLKGKGFAPMLEQALQNSLAILAQWELVFELARDQEAQLAAALSSMGAPKPVAGADRSDA